MFKLTTNRVWLFLLLATAVTWSIGETGKAWLANEASVLTIFALSYIKGYLVIDEFMGLRHAPRLWRRLLVAWLTLVVGMILLAYHLGRS